MIFDAGGVEPAKLNIRTDPLAIWTDPFAKYLYIYVYIMHILHGLTLVATSKWTWPYYGSMGPGVGQRAGWQDERAGRSGRSGGIRSSTSRGLVELKSALTQCKPHFCRSPRTRLCLLCASQILPMNLRPCTEIGLGCFRRGYVSNKTR